MLYDIKYKMSAVGFEPTPYYGTAPKAAALDHSAKLTIKKNDNILIIIG